MVLTRKQEEGLKIAVERYRNGEKYTCIAGYAGSGKSTLIKFIVQALDVDPERDVSYVAYTGKAASVLQAKGCQNATTAHKLLYKARLTKDGNYNYFPVDSIDYRVVVVDEISMLPKVMWQRLLTHNCYILATGDPGQLPPVDKDEDNHVLDKPHIFLDEIMRQAQDSEIIRLSMWIREGKPLASFPCAGQQVQIFTQSQVVSGMYEWADQMLCATNNKRNEVNHYMRELKGFGSEPCAGDKIISLHNHWDDLSIQGEWFLTNGTIGTLTDFFVDSHWLPRYISNDPITTMYSMIDLDDGDGFVNIPIDYKALTTGIPALDGRQCYLIQNNKKIGYIPPYDFAYAYAITCHKAQGSEWDKVLVFEEKFPFNTEEHKRWLYTAATRAKDKLVIVRK